MGTEEGNAVRETEKGRKKLLITKLFISLFMLLYSHSPLFTLLLLYSLSQYLFSLSIHSPHNSPFQFTLPFTITLLLLSLSFYSPTTKEENPKTLSSSLALRYLIMK